MTRPAAILLALTLSAAPACSWFGGSAIPDATAVQVEHLGVGLQTPSAWTRKDEPELNRTLFFLDGKDRDHAVILQKLPDRTSWRDHADRFREMQDIVLDKIQDEQRHEIAGGGVRFETRRQREGRPVVRKFVYYIEVGDRTVLLDMAAPEAKWEPKLYEAVAKTVAAAE